jgi:hypothetical protein
MGATDGKTEMLSQVQTIFGKAKRWKATKGGIKLKRNSLLMKSRKDRAEAITDKLFAFCDQPIKKDDRKAETIDDFLKRGGKINIIMKERRV